MIVFRPIPRRRNETLGTRDLRRINPRPTIDPMRESDLSNRRTWGFLARALRWFGNGLLRGTLGVAGARGGRCASGPEGHEGRIEGWGRVSLSSPREPSAFG